MHGDPVQEGQRVSVYHAAVADAIGYAEQDETVEGKDSAGECDLLVGLVCRAELFDELVFDYVRIGRLSILVHGLELDAQRVYTEV